MVGKSAPPQRVYLDTSVFGGYCDPEFATSSAAFFEYVFNGQLTVVVSDILLGELNRAPAEVKELLGRVLHTAERIGEPREALELRDEILRQGVLTAKWADDALHVANAIVTKVDFIASWNFKHIVHPAKMKAFNEVSNEQGYGAIVIMTPAVFVQSMEAASDEASE